MKKILTILLFAAFLFSETTCKKSIDDAIDCVAEALFVTVHADLDSTNQKLMHFEFDYNPSEGFTLITPLSWNFGDGNTISGGTSIDHEYENTGSYEAVVSYTLKKGNSSCSTSSNKHIVIP